MKIGHLDQEGSRAAGGSMRSLHQHHTISALDNYRFKTRPTDEYTNPIQSQNLQDYQLNHYSIEGAE